MSSIDNSQIAHLPALHLQPNSSKNKSDLRPVKSLIATGIHRKTSTRAHFISPPSHHKSRGTSLGPCIGPPTSPTTASGRHLKSTKDGKMGLLVSMGLEKKDERKNELGGNL